MLPLPNSPLPTPPSVMVSATVSAATASVVVQALLIGQWASLQLQIPKNHSLRQVRPHFPTLEPTYSTHHTGRGDDDGPSWLDFLTAPQPNSVNGIPPLPLHNPQHPHPHPHHPASFLNQRNFSNGPVSGSGYFPSPSLSGLSHLNLSRFSGSEDSRPGRRLMPLDNTYSPWASDASSQSGRSDSSMSMFRPSQTTFTDRDRLLEIEDVAPGAVTRVRSPLP